MMPRKYARITEHFYLWEFLQSEVMPNLSEYVPCPQEMANLTRLAMCLEGVRAEFESAIRITSGARPDTVRRLSDGAPFWRVLHEWGYPASKTSQHRFFCACDFTLHDASVSLWDVFWWLADSEPTPNQTILYVDERSIGRFIHCGIKDFNNPIKGTANPLLVHSEGVYSVPKAKHLDRK